MLALAVKNQKKVLREVQRLGSGVNRAAQVSINTVAFIARKNIIEEMKQVFDRPTKFTLNAIKVDTAKNGSSTARVWFRDPPRLSDSQHYLYPNVYGVKRGFKKYEAMLYAKGLLPRGWYTIPGKGATFDSYGNMSRGQIVQILSYFEAFQDKGFKANSTDKTRARLKKGSKSKYGISYFVIRPREKSHLKPGIYKKTYTGFGAAIKPVLRFVNKVSYERKLEFNLIGRRAYDKNFQKIFDKEITKLLSAA